MSSVLCYIVWHAAEEKQLKTMEEQVDSIWKPRLTAGDPFEGSLQNARVMLHCCRRTSLMQLSELLGFKPASCCSFTIYHLPDGCDHYIRLDFDML